EGRELYYSNTKYTLDTAGTQKWEIVTCAVILIPKTGIIGFTVNGTAVDHTVPITVNYGDTLVVTALLSEEYAFVSWSGSGYSDSKTNPLTISYITEDTSLTANGELIEYYVTFGSGSDYTVYANGSSQSPLSPIGVTGGGSLSFTVKTSEGYYAVPVINGIAYLTAQNDGSYVISEIHSNLNVTATVSADNSGNGSGSGNDSGNDPDASLGNSNDSGGDSDEGIPLWIPVLIAASFLVCIAAAAVGIVFLKRRKD
ncbi:MAG: hypothetical protein LBJ20_01840, partial [Candidatus Methanoplasma sp.]|nr:hypothetical protein [Candidatus Methanoplasma sp.]